MLLCVFSWFYSRRECHSRGRRQEILLLLVPKNEIKQWKYLEWDYSMYLNTHLENNTRLLSYVYQYNKRNLQVIHTCFTCYTVNKNYIYVYVYTVHILSLFQQCDFQRYRNIIIPPTSVQMEKGSVANIKPLPDRDWEPLIIFGMIFL